MAVFVLFWVKGLSQLILYMEQVSALSSLSLHVTLQGGFSSVSEMSGLVLKVKIYYFFKCIFSLSLGLVFKCFRKLDFIPRLTIAMEFSEIVGFNED